MSNKPDRKKCQKCPKYGTFSFDELTGLFAISSFFGRSFGEGSWSFFVCEQCSVNVCFVVLFSQVSGQIFDQGFGKGTGPEENN